jgi:hypothetical protein
MKQYFTLFFILIMGGVFGNLWAQNTIPQGFNYQAVIRDGNGAVASHVPVKLIFEILDSSPSGSVVYSEQHIIAQTNDYGLVNLVIGQGSPLSGQFSAVNWAASAKFMRISADINSSGSYIVLGGPGASTQLMSVPYALAAGNGGSGTAATAGQGIQITNNQINLDPQNAQTGQVLKWNGSAWVPQADNGGSLTLAAGTAIGIAQNGSTYTISNNGDTNPNDDLTTSTIAGGDLSGVFSDLQIKSGAVNTAELANGAVTATKLNTMGAANGQVLKFQSGAWAPATISGGNAYTGGTGITIQNNAINSVWSNKTIGNYNSIFPNPLTRVVIGDSIPFNENGLTAPLSVKGVGQTVISAEFVGSSNDSTAAIRGTGYGGYGGVFTSYTHGLLGKSTIPWASNAFGVKGEGYTGVIGEGYDIGVHGESERIGVNGESASQFGIGVQGVALSFNGGIGVSGESTSQYGIGVKASGGDGIALSASSNPGAKAAVFHGGDVDVRYGNLNVESIINVTNYAGSLRVALNKDVADAGFMLTLGPAGKTNFLVGSLASNANNGYASVAKNDVNKAGMYVNASGQGVVWGDVKNFRMPHPTQPGKEIWYASVEGPEAAAYTRGTGTMVHGEATVTFSEDYEIVASPNSMTVLLTPLDAESKGMAVVEKTANGFKVKELMHGTGNYQFDWEVKCVRKGYENYRVIRDERECQPAAQAEKTTLKHAMPNHVHDMIKPKE